MKLRMIFSAVVLVILAGVAVAQTPQMPKPGPEVKRLQYYAGTWHSELEMKMAPGGKMTGTDHSEMMPGGFFLVTHTEGKGMMGELKELAVMGYDPMEKVYTYDAFNSFGEAEHFKGTVQGDTWTWTSKGNFGGKLTDMRFTAKEVSPTSYTMKLEIAGDGGAWTTVMEGKAAKVK
ncbi:MAG TPA: DUF1579 family protein [Blastocatellia bacterium]|nr:DUF1579 family protein [Blastocatellia bacterium]